MHSQDKKKPKNLSSNTHQTEHVQSDSTRYVLSGDKRVALEEGEDQRRQDQTTFLHNAEDYNKHALLHIQTDCTVVLYNQIMVITLPCSIQNEKKKSFAFSSTL
ncbi:unnamed protein product, partial [Staurois parvus]